MAENKNYGLLISALVAIVAIVGLVVLLKGGATGGVSVIRGEARGSFDRPLGSRGQGFLGEGRPCWYTDGGEMVCPHGVTGNQRSFGPAPEYRRGRVPAQIDYASGRGFTSS